ncbi:MAG: DNA repair protein RecN, partial [Pseudomonadota bacterium]|nr:DNA repair protein RecN [Pseudomonadota bacterium]
ASLIEACELALQQLSGDDAIASRLQQVRSALRGEVSHEPRLGEVDEMLDSAAIQMDEALSMLERIREDLDVDPVAMLEFEQRLVRVQDLARKHRLAPAQLAGHRDALASELESLADADERLQRLEQAINAANMHWRGAASELTASRQRAGDALGADVSTLIGTLGMEGGRFEVALEPISDPAMPDPMGAERAEFLVSANAGQPPRPLRKVASGGELSRISLAIEVAMQGSDPVPTMVFDEVDAGIGGAVAAAVGARLRALGDGRQVLCVTHQPQVAAAGHAHYRVSKAAREGITMSSVERLGQEGRILEIARMLGGAKVTVEGHAAAKRLLGD